MYHCVQTYIINRKQNRRVSVYIHNSELMLNFRLNLKVQMCFITPLVLNFHQIEHTMYICEYVTQEAVLP